MQLTQETTEYKELTPTIPSRVSKDTKLESLNLNWNEKELPERERTKHVHRLHPYLGKFIPQLVEIFLRKYFEPGQTILDPFCGSGTTLIQANELGINTIGYDVSAFNVLLSKVKIEKYDISSLNEEVLDILKKVNEFSQRDKNQLSLWKENLKLENPTFVANQYLKEWYKPKALNELLAYKFFLETGNYKYKDLLKIILSRSARSARLTTHYDLDFPKFPQNTEYWCYKHSRTCTPTEDALKFISRYSLDTIRRIKEFSHLRTNALSEVHHQDSRQAAYPPIDGVITSPPYVGLIDYHLQHEYAYHLLGLEDNSQDEIGPAANGASKKAQQKYIEALANVFINAKNALAPGGRMIIIAADTKNLYEQIAKLVDVEIEAIVQRHVNRRTGRRSNEFYESVFIWRKL